jgi:transposase
MELMSRKHWKRLEVLEQLTKGKWQIEEARRLLDLSRRQVSRLKRRYLEQGALCVRHGNKGRSPPNRLREDIRRQIVELRQGKYEGFNDQHFAEKLAEAEGIVVSRATVRRILRGRGIGSPRKRRPRKYRKRRERKAQAGLMILWDGSKHDWLEGRGPKLCLMGAIDDGTSELLAGAHFVEQECSVGYLRVLYELVRQHGVPWQAYMDKHGSLHRNDDYWTRDEELAGRQEPTQVGRALEILGIEVIFANSPQAKGRVERAWGTLQDRLTSELRLAGARTVEDANAVLKRYRPKYNRRFAVTPADRSPAWRQLPAGLDLQRVCSFYNTAIVRNDNTIQCEGQVIDIPPGPNRTSYAGKVVEVRRLLDGQVRVYLADSILTSHQAQAPSSSPTHRRKNSKAPQTPTKPKPKRRLTLKEIMAKYTNAA